MHWEVPSNYGCYVGIPYRLRSLLAWTMIKK